MTIHPANEAEVQKIKDKLEAFNDAIAGPDQHQPLNLAITDSQGQVVAGLVGGTYWGWLYVDRLWVDAAHRAGGLGTQLVRAAEAEARSRGCHHAHLDTMSWQALGFYQKLGYLVRCELADFPSGHRKFMLTKAL